MRHDFKTGFYASGLAHGGLLVWLLIGGFFTSRDVDPIPVTDISIISSDEFAALLPSSPDAESETTEPAAPQIEAAPELPTPEPDAPLEAGAQALQSQPTPADQPDALPDPVIRPQPVPQVLPEQPLDPGADAAPEIAADATPTPEAAPRVAPEAAPAPEPDVQPDEVLQTQTAPSPEATQIEEAEVETAPEEASTDIVTEAEEQVSTAPENSPRPTSRPAQPAPQVVAEEVPQEAEPETDPIAESVAAAVAEQAAEPSAEPAAEPAPQETASAAPTGPPMSSGEKDSFGRQINRCWSVGALSTEAKNTVIQVDFDMLPDGKPDIGSLTLFSGEGASDAAIQRAFQNARSTIIRCGQSGYELPSEKYEQWKQVRVIFDASGAQYR